ncbi:MAG: DUF4163 domain-containing protein [Odoribacter sp.]|nr:DUF4163 domain-containing protein [Odoribacter sp.]
MKNYFWVLIGMLLILGACKDVKKIDVKKDSYNDTTSDWDIKIKRSVFSSEDEVLEEAAKVVNARVIRLIDSLSLELKNNVNNFYHNFSDDPDERPRFSYEMTITDTVFMADKNFISLRLQSYSYEGGAHGQTEFFTVNYDINKKKFFGPGQILNLNRVRDINDKLKANFENKDNCFTEIPTLGNGYTAMNISSSTIILTYPQYTLGPNSCGFAEVYVPKSDLKGIILLK